MKNFLLRFLFLLTFFPFFTSGGEGDEMLAKYLEQRTVQIEESFLREVGSKDDWNKRKETHREQLWYMLGLSSDRPRADLKATVTGLPGVILVKTAYYTTK